MKSGEPSNAEVTLRHRPVESLEPLLPFQGRGVVVIAVAVAVVAAGVV